MRTAPRLYRVTTTITREVEYGIEAWREDDAKAQAWERAIQEFGNEDDIAIRDITLLPTCNVCGRGVDADNPICSVHGKLDPGDQW